MSDMRAGFGESWYGSTMVEAPDRAALGTDLDVDVCVIGAGLAGLTTALELARRGWSVAVLEGQRVGWNASGRNCGFVVPGFGEDVRRIVDRVGIARARELWALSEQGLDYVRQAIDEHALPGVDPQPGWLEVSRIDQPDDLLASAAVLSERFGVEVEGWSTERVREAMRSEQYFLGLYYPSAFHIHPLNYALGLAAAAERAGARIYEGTPAIELDAAGVRKRVATPAARVRAGQIVLAGNVHLGRVLPKLADTLAPITSFVAVTTRLGRRLDEAIRYRGAVSAFQSADHHFRIVDEDRLMWGGGFAVWDADPRRRVDRFRRAIAEAFPQLGGVAIEFVWSGVLGKPLHKMPQIGEMSPGVWVASGFAGHGLNTTAMAGQLIASAILDSDDRWRMFGAYDLSWAGGRLGRAVAQVAYWSRRTRDNFHARGAVKRDRLRRRGVAI